MALLTTFGANATLCAAACSFDADRFKGSTRDAIELLERREYRRAIPLLEDAWAASPAEYVLAEWLGIAYLYSIGQADTSLLVERARQTMAGAIEAGGRAAFVLDYSNSPKSKLDNLDRGLLFVDAQSVEFCSTRSDLRIEIPVSAIRAFGFHRKAAANMNAFWLQTGPKSQYLFRPSTFRAEEVETIFSFLGQASGLSATPTKTSK